jgi:hypothetical protein
MDYLYDLCGGAFIMKHGQTVSGFIIALLLVAIPVVGFTLFYVSGSQTYGVEYTDTTEGLNQYAALNGSISTMNNRLENRTVSSGGFAIIGDYLGYAKDVLFITIDSLNLFSTMADTGYENVASGTTNSDASGALSIIRYIIISIVIVLFVAAILAFLAGRNKV